MDLINTIYSALFNYQSGDEVLYIDSTSQQKYQNEAVAQNLKTIKSLNVEYNNHNSPQFIQNNHSTNFIPPTYASTFRTVRICVISDTHEGHSNITHLIPHCDILIHTGDILMKNRKILSKDGSMIKLREFNNWLSQLPAKNVVVIGGNHDKILETLGEEEVQKMLPKANYLMNSSICINGLNIFGTPASMGDSPNRAFQSSRFLKETEQILRNFNESNRIHLLLTHSRCEELSLIARPLIAHCWGHVHSWHGVSRVSFESSSWLSICSSIMDNHYMPTQVPIVFDVKI